MGQQSTGVFHLLLLAATTVTAHSLVKLSTDNLLVAPCHHRVTLHCNISSETQPSVIHLAWLNVHTGKQLCVVDDLGELTEAQGVHCIYEPGEQLILTFRHIRAVDQGQYICKLRSNRGIKEVSATVKLQECYRGVHHDSSSSAMTCSFSGVYPEGEVHWFDGDRNITGDSQHHSIKFNHDGTFNVSGSLPARTPTRAHHCSLWMHGSGSYLARHLLPQSSQIHSQAGNGATSVQVVGMSLGLLLAWLLMP
ncbi:uncharacterized protein LOC108939770 [Scleropages formosus]|uniref:uncharacterized protein LOC108939770 n=1 Tax=Scleropages formosus TaxID=113540 RepID=UPI000878E482|nr:uncharacterized protein LOC108939770 [Scleropages formosus]XP_018616889.1 uncharacterized protein LOC108939770 [Scleropages formosus]